MDSIGPVPGAGSTQQPSAPNSPQAGASAEEQAIFDQAVQEMAAAELLTDHFVVTQPILDDINKESSK